MAKKKEWEDLELKDDFMFAKVMRNPEICKETLEKLLNIEIERIEYPEEQKVIDITTDGRSVRLDVYVKDDKQTVYDMEIQTTNTRELPKRSRYYQGMLDLNLIEKGESFKKLNTSYIIFICTFDLFGKGFHRYTFSHLCEEDPTVLLEDEATKIFFNTEGTANDVNSEVKAFLDLVGGRKTDNEFSEKILKEVERIKENKEWRRDYMTLWLRDLENREEGREEGKKDMVLALLKQGILSREEIASVAELTIEQLEEMEKQLLETV